MVPNGDSINMKKLAIASLILGTITSGAASAAQSGEVRFIGTVTDVTCNITPEIDGLTSNVINLGTMKTDGSGAKDVEFQLVPSTKECLEKTNASVVWQSAAFTNNGLANTQGDAKGVSIQLTAVNSVTPNQNISGNMQNITFGDGKDKIGAFKFKTKMVKNTSGEITAGTVASSASYAVSYK